MTGIVWSCPRCGEDLWDNNGVLVCPQDGTIPDAEIMEYVANWGDE